MIKLINTFVQEDLYKILNGEVFLNVNSVSGEYLLCVKNRKNSISSYRYKTESDLDIDYNEIIKIKNK